MNEHVERVKQQAQSLNIQYSNEIIVGEPDECLLDTMSKHTFDLIVMGSPRPKGVPGLRSKMMSKKTRSLPVPVLIAPYPLAAYDNAADG